MGATGFDRARSSETDSTIGDCRKQSKTINAANDARYDYALAA